MPYLRSLPLRFGIALSAAAALIACGGGDAQPAVTPVAREILLAPTPTTAPQLNDAPAKSASAPAAPRAKQKAVPKPAAAPPQSVPPAPTVIVTPINVAPSAAPPAPAAPAPHATGAVAEGVVLAVHPSARICTNTHRVGDRVTATLVDPVQGSNGLVIPAGSETVLLLTRSARSENNKDSVRLAFEVTSVRVGDATYEVGGSVAIATPIERVRAQSTGDQAKKVGAGAVIGAIAGQIIGRNTRSTVIGGAVGAAAGAAVASGTSDYNGCVPTSGTLAITLTRPLVVGLPAAQRQDQPD